jgi:thiamine-monophosphate kinase
MAALSDLAAMGAHARWATLGLSLPVAEPTWLEGFAGGVSEALVAAGVSLIGGDTTKGNLTICWTMLGTLPPGAALTRAGGRAGDFVYVSGTLGDARGALECLHDAHVGDLELALIDRYWRPQARLTLGRVLRDLATSCIDISDGLLADLGHLTAASGCGAEIDVRLVPQSDALAKRFDNATAAEFALRGGDDYELCFSVPPTSVDELDGRVAAIAQRVTRIGRLTAGPPGVVADQTGSALSVADGGWRHF